MERDSKLRRFLELISCFSSIIIANIAQTLMSIRPRSIIFLHPDGNLRVWKVLKLRRVWSLRVRVTKRG